MCRTISTTVLVACMFVGASLPCLAAQEPGRVLNGHAFMPSEVIPTPFALSHFGTVTGGGVAFDLKTPFVNFEGETLGTLKGDVAFLSLGFRYQRRLGNRFAARGAFAGAARVGIDEQSILAQGVTGVYGLGLGGTFRILQSETVILSCALDFNTSELIGVDPFGFASRIIEEGLDAEDNDLVRARTAAGGRGTLMAAWAPWHWLGLTGFVDGGRAGIEEVDWETSMGGGGSAGVDLKNLDLIPLGFQLVAKTDALSKAGGDLRNRSWSYGFGLFYTGWDDFSVSVENTMNVLERQGEGDDFEAFVTTFNLRYWP